MKITGYETKVFSSSRHAEDVRALKEQITKLTMKLLEVTNDRNEWRDQHENLLAIYRAELAKRETA